MSTRARRGRWLAGVAAGLVLASVVGGRSAAAEPSPLEAVRAALQQEDRGRAIRLGRAAAEQAAAASPVTLNEVGVLDRLSGLFQEWGCFREAEEFSRQTIELARRMERPTNLKDLVVFQANNRLGLLYYAEEHYAEADAQYRRCRRLLEDGDIDPFQRKLAKAGLGLNAGKLYEMTGQYGRAKQAYQEVLDQLPPAQNEAVYRFRARALNNLGWLYHRLRQYEDARDAVTQARGIYRDSLPKLRTDPALVLNNLGLIRFALGDLGQAEDLLRQSLAIDRQELGEHHPDLARAMHNLACVCRARGEAEEAHALYERATALLEGAKGKQHPDVAAARGYLAWFQAAQGDWAAAADEMDRARRIFRSHIRRVLSAQSEEEQLAFLEKKDRPWFDAALTLGLKAGGDSRGAELSAAWVLNGKGMTLQVLAERTVLARQSQNSEASALYRELCDVREQLAARSLRSAAAGRQAEESDRDLARREGDLSHQLALALRSPVGEEPWADVAAVQRVLTDDRALAGDAVLIDIAKFRVVDFAAPKAELEGGEEHYAAWVVPPAGAVQAIDLGPARVIDAAVADLREELLAAMPEKVGGRDRIAKLGEGESENRFRAKSAALARLLLGPMYAAIHGTKRWIVSPDGALWLVPWSALVLPEGGAAGPYAVEKHTISFVSSGRDLLAARPPRVERTAPLMLADPDFGRAPRGKGGLLTGFERLPVTSAEADEIRPFLERYAGRRPVLLKRGEAEERAFRDARSPAAVVLSTHGFFLDRGPGRPDNPLLRCGLALAHVNEREGDSPSARAARNDGLLLGLEILDTDLRGTDLVVLNACETALGNVRSGEGVANLQSAFQLAGARTVVATLWEVEELQTALLMRDYFKALADDRLDKAEALRQAQLTRIKERRRGSKRAAHPFYWAAVNVIGQWADTLGD